MRAQAMALWKKLPVVITAPIIAFIVLNIGSTATVLPLIGNVKFQPEIPWALPATLLILAAFWFYFTGRGFPASTQAARRNATREKQLPGAIWRAVIPALIFSLIATTSLRLILPSLLPVDPPSVAFDLGPYPLVTVIGLLLSIAISAGVVEEVAFRGYLQKNLEDAYGLVPAILLTGVAFWFAHADKVSLSHLPFHLLSSIFLGLVAYFTRSLLPSIVGHALGDALLQPAYLFHSPSFVWSALSAKPIWDPNSTLAEKMSTLGQAANPANLVSAGPHQTFAVLAWVFVFSTGLAVLSLMRLRQATRAMPTKSS
jgi:membrane protease YdiL (CAAX protease family)